MKARLLSAIVLAALLGGCESAAKLAEMDDAKCRSYGATPGDAAYVQCRSQLDAARTQATAIDMARASAAANAPSMYQPPPPVDLSLPSLPGHPRAY